MSTTSGLAAARPSTARIWLVASRPATLPAAVAPVLAGSAAASWATIGFDFQPGAFVAAMIGAVKSGSEFVLAMTGGGPYAPYGETEVIGLHIFWQAFGYLRFGSAVAMAWILGTLLIGFTVLQLQRLSRMEFRTVATDE